MISSVYSAHLHVPGRRLRWHLVGPAVLAAFLLTTDTGVVFSDLAAAPAEGGLWELARTKRDTLAVSTLFTAQNVRDFLSSEKGLAEAIRWCKSLGVTRVFIESFRDGYWAKRETLTGARDRFRREGLKACGCVTTTRMGTISTGWKLISCYTDAKTRTELASIFAYTASIFDCIMIDDFFFTDCTCPACTKARGQQSWVQYRLDLMCNVSRRDVLQAARKANPRVTCILKYPQWYDNFHNRGYDVVRQPPLYDQIWVGTETRDPDSQRWGRKAQYEAYFIMRWLGGIGGPKCGGGWFDPYGTSPPTYVEQARQTVLAGAREMLLFCYGSLHDKQHTRNPTALRPEIPLLFKLAGWVRNGRVRGIPAVKPPASQPAPGEEYIFDWVGMLGFPLDPTHILPPEAPVILVTSHLRSAPGWKRFLTGHFAAGKPALATKAVLEDVREVAQKTGGGSVHALTWNGDRRSVMDMPEVVLDRLRKPLLTPLGLTLQAPGRVALYLPADTVIVLENFADTPAAITFTDSERKLQPAGRIVLPPKTNVDLRVSDHRIEGTLPPRTMVAWRLQ